MKITTLKSTYIWLNYDERHESICGENDVLFNPEVNKAL